MEATGGEMRTGDRATGYESRARMGISGITGGRSEGHRKDHPSIITGSRGVDPGGTRETTIGGTGVVGTTGSSGRDDRGYTFATTGGHDMGHASASTTIPTSTVAREYVSEPGIKESNTNVKSYMTGLGAGSDIGAGTIPGTGTGTGTGSGTRMYTAGGDSSASRARADPLSSRAIRDVDTLSTGKNVDHGTRTYTISNGATAARMTGDIGTSSFAKGVGSEKISTPKAARNTVMSSYVRDVGSSGTGLRVNEDASSRPRMDSDRLSYIKEIAASLKLGAKIHGDERSHLPGKVPKVTAPGMTSYSDGSARPRTYRADEDSSAAQTAGQPRSNKDPSFGVGPSRGPGAGTRRYTIGGDTYSVGARGDADRIGDIASTTRVATKTTDSKSREDSRRVDQRTPAGGRRASHSGTRDQSSTLSYIKDAASAFGIGSGSGSGTGESYLTTKIEDKSTLETPKDKVKGVSTVGIGPGFAADTRTRGDGRAYTSGDTPSTRIGDSRDFITGGDSTLSRMGGDSQTYSTSGDTSTTRPSDPLSYIKETAATSPGGTGTGPGYGPTSTTARITLTPSRGTQRDTKPDAEYYSRDFTTRDNMVGTAQAPPHSKDFALGLSGTHAVTPSTTETRSGAHVPSYENREAMMTGSQGASGRVRAEGYTIIHPAKVAEDQVRAGERSERETRGAGRVEQRMGGDREQSGQQGLGERYIIGRRTMQEPGAQPSGSFRDDASAKHDRIRLELEKELHEIEQEALRIAKGKETRRTTGVTSPGQKYSSLVGSGEPTEHKRDREDMARISTRDRQEIRIPGDFDTQERYDAAATSSQVQPGKPSHEPIPLDSERRQQQELRECEVEKAARESSMERHRTTDLARTGSGPGGMRTTMRGSPEYREQRASDSGPVTTGEKEGRDEKVMESQFEGDDDEGSRRGILGRAADKMGHLLKT